MLPEAACRAPHPADHPSLHSTHAPTAHTRCCRAPTPSQRARTRSTHAQRLLCAQAPHMNAQLAPARCQRRLKWRMAAPMPCCAAARLPLGLGAPSYDNQHKARESCFNNHTQAAHVISVSTSHRHPAALKPPQPLGSALTALCAPRNEQRTQADAPRPPQPRYASAALASSTSLHTTTHNRST